LRNTEPHPAHEALAARQTRGESIANRVDDASGTLAALLVASGSIVVWALLGPHFGFSNTWQLVINTGTTIVTFLLAFLVKYGQRRQSEFNKMIADHHYAETGAIADVQAQLEQLTRAIHAVTVEGRLPKSDP